MDSSSLTFEAIVTNFSEISLEALNSVLVLYDEQILFIGDCCARFDKFKYFREYLHDADITINFSDKKNEKFADGLLKGNPNLDLVTYLTWDAIDFEKYDLVFCVTSDEEALLNFFHEKYGTRINSGLYRLAVCSISELILQVPSNGYLFPVDEELNRYVKRPRPGELYITDEEHTWAEEWLKEKGLRAGEDLFIILDSTSIRSKLMKITVYFEFLLSILKRTNVKILIFDESTIGKEEFYREWLDADNMKKMIFSKGLSLRDNLCLIASRHTRLVFGPCTGLMHCSSSIYNNCLNNGMEPASIPLMITYTGVYSKANKNAYFWWGNAPLMHCLLLKMRGGRKKMVELTNLTEEEKLLDDSLPSTEYTADMLLGFIDAHLQEHRHLSLQNH